MTEVTIPTSPPSATDLRTATPRKKTVPNLSNSSKSTTSSISMLTIFTPTYNREKLLTRLYNSLASQQSKDFVWLIVDDGSTDGTSSLVAKWQKEDIIPVQYIWQENSGKHVAHNTAVKACTTDWFVCVDSDDYLAHNNVVAEINTILNSLDDKHALGGVVMPKIIIEKENFDCLPGDNTQTTLRNLYRNGFKGETTLIYRIEILRNYLFPVFEGEKFVTEVVVYDQIDDHYQLLFKNTPVVVCEYQDDGYSRNFQRLLRENPQGWAFRFNQQAKYALTFRSKFNNCAQFVCFSLAAGNRNWLHDASFPILSIITLPTAIYYLHRINCQKQC